MHTPTALITGANRGLGFEIARQLGGRGHRLVLGARDPALGEDAAAALRDEGFDARAVQLDVTAPADVAGLAAAVRERVGPLDVLVNNAGVNVDAWAGPSELVPETLRESLETNLIGALETTRAVLPLLRESPAGRIVNVSSTLGSLTDIGNPASPYAAVTQPAYQISKAALNALKVNSACPGWVRTRLGGERAPVSVEDGARTPVWLATLPDDGPSGAFFDANGPVPW